MKYGMSRAWLGRGTVLALTMLSLGACTVYSQPARTEVRSGEYYPPAPAPAQPEVVYDQPPPPPPAPVIEAPPAAPGPDFVWIAGYQRWTGRGYTWNAGHYDRRPHPNAQWRAPHWENRGRGHVWIEGGWN